MNLRRTLHILGLPLIVLACAQLLPLLWSLADGELRDAAAFVFGAGSTALVGACFRYVGNTQGELYRREGVLVVVGSWVLGSLAGAIPYVASGAIPNPIDALFESASGFTTTGASILRDVEALGNGMLLWRSMTQWLGGVGIVVLFVALLGELGPGARFLFRLEVPGPKTEILHARVQQTALMILRIYLAMSALEVLLLLACGLSVYDALTHTFSTVSTGGFSPHSDSVGHFGPPARLVITLFMVAAGGNFSLYYQAVRRRDLRALRDAELRSYLALVAIAVLVVFFNLSSHGTGELGERLLDAAFQVASIVTTTGFATTNFDAWPDLSRTVLVMLMFVGGCAGSTAGGIKVIRLILGWRATVREIRQTFSPNAVIAIVVGGRAVPESSMRSVSSFLVIWMIAWAVGALLLSVGDTGIATAATASIATLANVGPGLDQVGPTAHYAFFSGWQKLLMVMLMWLGRLELFALLAVFQRHFWRR